MEQSKRRSLFTGEHRKYILCLYGLSSPGRCIKKNSGVIVVKKNLELEPLRSCLFPNGERYSVTLCVESVSKKGVLHLFAYTVGLYTVDL